MFYFVKSLILPYLPRYAPRWDCGSVYEVRVELLNHKKKAITFFQPEPVTLPQWNDQQWKQVSHIYWIQCKTPGVSKANCMLGVGCEECYYWTLNMFFSFHFACCFTVGFHFIFYMLQISKHTLHFIIGSTVSNVKVKNKWILEF